MDEVFAFYVQGADGSEIVYFDNDDRPQTKANALLIAAAPELASEGDKALAAIDDLIFALTFERVDDKHPNTIGRAKEVAASLLAAIAKARGGA